MIFSLLMTISDWQFLKDRFSEFRRPSGKSFYHTNLRTGTYYTK
ncbi:MAG: hypothetical protein ABI840_02650 [bacterium]